jgi:hypothetical protein
MVCLPYQYVVESADMEEQSFVLVYWHWPKLTANLQLLTLEKTDDCLQNLYQKAVGNEEVQHLQEFQQFHLRMSCLSLLNSVEFFSFAQVVDDVRNY